ncbi:hypothetical protein VTJ04DRAFT_10771 [Mycothermus thermophilus]|uniref:uncharacterized protein n=1 Tax=Humicola insolens TaxID=85995 RepID=UPI003742EFFC
MASFGKQPPPFAWEMPTCTCHYYYQYYLCGCPDQTRPSNNSNNNNQPGVHIPSLKRCDLYHQPFVVRLKYFLQGFRHNPNPPLRYEPSVLPFPCFKHTMDARVYLPPEALALERQRLLDPIANPVSAKRHNENTRKMKRFLDNGRTWEYLKRKRDAFEAEAKKQQHQQQEQEEALQAEWYDDDENLELLRRKRRAIEVELPSFIPPNIPEVIVTSPTPLSPFDDKIFNFPPPTTSTSSSSSPTDSLTSSPPVSPPPERQVLKFPSNWTTIAEPSYSPSHSPPSSPPNSPLQSRRRIIAVPVSTPTSRGTSPASSRWTSVLSSSRGASSTSTPPSSRRPPSSFTSPNPNPPHNSINPPATPPPTHFCDLAWLLEEQSQDLWRQESYQPRPSTTARPLPPTDDPYKLLRHIFDLYPAEDPHHPHHPFPLCTITSAATSSSGSTPAGEMMAAGAVKHPPAYDLGPYHTGYHAGAYKLDSDVLHRARLAAWERYGDAGRAVAEEVRRRWEAGGPMGAAGRVVVGDGKKTGEEGWRWLSME